MLTEETPFSRLTLCDDGIIEAQPLRTEEPRTAELLTQALDAIERVAGGIRRPLLWDATGTLPLAPRGWQAIVDRIERLFTAMAIIVEDVEEPLLGAFPVAIDSLLIPVRVFPTKASGRDWLSQFANRDLGTG
jgi:hypothetical protein